LVVVDRERARAEEEPVVRGNDGKESGLVELRGRRGGAAAESWRVLAGGGWVRVCVGEAAEDFGTLSSSPSSCGRKRFYISGRGEDDRDQKLFFFRSRLHPTMPYLPEKRRLI
jgi:hypothetical protein